MKYYKHIFIAVILVAFLLRFIGLDLMPVNLSNDEISIAYDAYSVSKTLRDEYGHFLPLSFQSHNTYKAPLTIYLTIPFITLLGNNDYGVRTASAILGTLTVLFLGMLVYELSKNKKLALITAIILALTPWHIYSSRMILESNIALFFVVLGIYLFYKGVNTGRFLWTSFSLIAFSLSIYAYHTEWVFTPILLVGLIILNYKKIKNKKLYFFGLLFFAILSAPIYLDAFLSPSPTRRSSSELFLNDIYLHGQLVSSSYNIFQKGALVIKRVIDNYSQYTNLGYLFFNGLDIGVFLSDFRIMVKNPPLPVGLFLQIFLPLFFYGIYKLKKYFPDNFKEIYFWTILSPLVPALTLGGTNSVRFLVAVAPFTLIIAVGLYEFYGKIKSKSIKYLTLTAIFISFVYFAFSYYFQFTLSARYNYLYNYKEIVSYIKNHYNDYDRIVMDGKFGDDYLFYGVPDLYIGFYASIDPQNYLNTRVSGDNGLYFNKFVITSVNWQDEINGKSANGKSLLIAPVSNPPPVSLKNNLNLLYTTYFPNRSPSFNFYTVK